MKQLSIHGLDTRYQIQGSGPDLLLLHGFMESLEVFTHLVPQLAQHFRVTVVDLPGHGNTGISPAYVSMNTFGEWVHALVSQLKLENPIVVGHSLGGYVALAYAHLHPQAPGGIGLWHSSAYADSEERKQNRDKGIAFVRKHGVTTFAEGLLPKLFLDEGKAHLAQVLAIATKTPPEGVVTTLKAMKDRSNHQGLLRKLPCPVLFLQGWQDNIIPGDDILAQAQLPMRAMLVGMHQVAHMGMYEAPQDCVRALQAFGQYCTAAEAQ